MDTIKLPNNIFFTGVPGSRWSGIAQLIESLPGFNTTDRNSDREYAHSAYSGHVGAYFGTGMEFNTDMSKLDDPYTDPSAGCKLLKSHEWAYNLKWINRNMKDDWIMLVYRPDLVSQAWWHEAGGFGITYPNYDYYKDSTGMLIEIQRQNQRILEFAFEKKLTWNYFTAEWCYEMFGYTPGNTILNWNDVLVTIYKNE